MSSLFLKYQQEITPKLKQDLSIANSLAIPKIEKIVINVGAAEAIENKDVLEKIKEQLSTIGGQKPQIRVAKKAISTFKLKKNDPIGVRVTLRGKRAWNFLEKLIAIVLPRVRDFRGIPQTKFDKDGNYSLGLSEQTLFPEVDYSKVDKIRGLVVTIVVKNTNQEKSKIFFELLGIPFQKN